MNNHSRVAIALAGLVLLSGCATLGLGGPSISATDTGVTSDGVPYLAFEYSTDDYATALLENPENQIVDKRELSPEENQSALALGEPQAGSYSLVLQQGGETKVEKEVVYDGPSPEIVEVEPTWSGATLEEVAVTVENTGDLPTRISSGSYSARAQSVSQDSMYRWVEPNGTTTVTLSSGYQGAISIEEPGEANVAVRLETSNNTLSTTFTKTFEGPKLEIDSIEPNWDGADLKSAQVWIENTGDMPTTANASIEHAGETLAYSGPSSIAPGERTQMEIASFLYVYSAEGPGSIELDLIVDGENQHLSDTISHEVEDAKVTINSFSTTWENGRLTDAKGVVENNGEVEGDIRVGLLVDGSEVSGWDIVVSEGDTRTVKFGDWSHIYSVTSGGTVDVTFEVSGPAGSDTKTESKSFEGIDTSISNADSLFIGNYDSDTSDLSSLDFDVQNRGDVVLTYDTIEVEIDGVSSQESMSFESELAPGESTKEYYSGDLTVNNGKHTVTIRILNDGEVVGTTQATVSTSD